MLESLFKKETLTQVFSREYCEIFKNTYFEEHLRTAAFVGFSSKNVYIYILSTSNRAEQCFHNWCMKGLQKKVKNITFLPGYALFRH